MPTKNPSAYGDPSQWTLETPANTNTGDASAWTLEKPAASSVTPSGWGIGGAFQGLGEGLQDLKQGLTTLPHALAHPGETFTQMGEQQRALDQRARTDWRSGHYGNAIWHAVDAALPVVGPMDAMLTDEYQGGNKSAAMTRGAVNAIPYAFDPVGGARKLVGKGIQAAGRGLEATGATGDSLRLLGTRKLTNGTPGQLLQKALKPGVQYGAGAADTLQEALPHVLESDPSLQGVGGFAKASDIAKEMQYGKYKDLTAPYRSLEPGAAGPVRSGTVHGGPIAKAQMASIPVMDLIEDTGTPRGMGTLHVPDPEGGTLRMGAPETPRGGILERTRRLASKYDKPIDIPTLDAIREDANAKLNSFYNKAGGDQAAALSNPETARVKAVGDATRQVLYPKLEEGAGLASGTVARMQSTYGKLADTADIANKREPVFARHDPVNLAQTIAASHGGPIATVFNWAKESALRKLTDSDALVNSAVDRYRNPLATPLQSRPGLIPKALVNAGTSTGRLGGAITRVPLTVPPLAFTPRDSR